MSDSVAKSKPGFERKKLAWWRYVPWVLAACCLMGLIWMRSGAEVPDLVEAPASFCRWISVRRAWK